MFNQTVRFGGLRCPGFSLQGPSDPDVFAGLTPAQKTWVQGSLVLLNTKVMQATGTTCPTWTDPGVNLANAVACFQAWYNANYGPTKAPSAALRTDGTLDADTLAAIQMIAGMHPADFNVPFPTSAATSASAPTSTAVTKAGMSTGMKIGVGVAGAAALSAIFYATKRTSRRR